MAKQMNVYVAVMDSPFSSPSPFSDASPTWAPRPAVTFAAIVRLLPTLPAAVGIGVLYHFIGQYLDLFIVFPLLVGLGVGAVLSALAQKQKVRSKIALCFLAIVGGLLCFSSRWVANALHERETFINSYTSRLGSGNPALEAKAQTLLRRAYPPAKFIPLYLKVAEKQGVTFYSTPDSPTSRHTPATGSQFWGLMFVEGALMCGAAIFMVWKQATHPFCAPCDSWYGVELTASYLPPYQTKEATRLVQNSEWEGLSELDTSGVTSKSNCEVVFSKCPGCSSGQVSVRQRSQNKVETTWSSPVPAADVQRLEAVRGLWLG